MERKVVFVALVMIILASSFVYAEDLTAASKDADEIMLESFHGDFFSPEYHNMCYEKQKTLIAGRIYMADTNKSVSGADVTVTCEHNGKSYSKTTKSNFAGKYMVLFKNKYCNDGDSVTVYADKDGNSGSEEGTVVNGKWIFKHYDVAFINVPLIPEFGLIIGIVTSLGALVAFFVIRRY